MLKELLSHRPIQVAVVLVVIIGISGILYLNHVKTETEGTVVNPETSVGRQEIPSASTPEPATQGGHRHADGTWHAEAHPPAEQGETIALSGVGETWRDGVWYPENYTQADIADDLAGLPAEPGEEYHRRAYKFAVNTYIQKHREKYPDCTEYQAVIDDAKRFAVWRLADQEITDKYSELSDEFEYWADELELLLEKYDYSPVAEATHIPESERLNDIERIKVLNAQLDDHTERRAALNYEELIYPKPRHTH